jgi:hypothetical protein
MCYIHVMCSSSQAKIKSEEHLNLGGSQAGFDDLCAKLRHAGYDVHDVLANNQWLGKVYGVALLTIEPVVDGPLGLLSDQQRFAWHVHGQPNMVFLKVRHVVALQHPHVCETAHLTKNTTIVFPLERRSGANIVG